MCGMKLILKYLGKPQPSEGQRFKPCVISPFDMAVAGVINGHTLSLSLSHFVVAATSVRKKGKVVLVLN
jgi:hypothetical protein